MGSVVVFLIIGFVMYKLFIAQQQKQLTLWTEAADNLGIARPSRARGLNWNASLRGVVDGFPVSVQHIKGKNTNFVRYIIEYPHVGVDLKLQAQRGFSRFLVSSKVLSRMTLGGEDLITGDMGFDDDIVVTGADPDALLAFLTPSRRASILRLLDYYKSTKIGPTQLEASIPGTPSSGGQVAETVRRFTSVAAVLSGTAEGIDHAIDAIEHGDLVQGLHELDAVEGPTRVEAQLTRAEILAGGAGTPDEIDAALPSFDAVAPTDPEAVALHAAAEGLRLGPPPPLSPSEPSIATAPQAPAAAQDAQLDLLFGQSALDGRAAFEAQVQGTIIEWTGVVRHARRFANDLDFGPGPGIKAVLGVGSVDMGTYGEVEIDVVVALPADTVLEPDQTVTFAGTAHKIDGFTRNLFVTNGALRG